MAVNNGIAYLVEDGEFGLIREVRLSDGQVLRLFNTPYMGSNVNSGGAYANVVPEPATLWIVSVFGFVFTVSRRRAK